jgi:hypothetical protein
MGYPEGITAHHKCKTILVGHGLKNELHVIYQTQCAEIDFLQEIQYSSGIATKRTFTYVFLSMNYFVLLFCPSKWFLQICDLRTYDSATLLNPKMNQIWLLPLRSGTKHLLCESKTGYISFSVDFHRRHTGAE